MGRPFSNIAQISMGFEMYARGYGRAAILKAFPCEPKPTVRTLGNWIGRYKKVSSADVRLEQQFEWRDMDMFSISWDYVDLISRLITLEAYVPSVRRVRWWFRAKKMYPHYPDDRIAILAKKFIVNDHMDLLGIPGSDWTTLSDLSYEDRKIQLYLLPGTFAFCFFELDTTLPGWIQNGVFLSIVRTEQKVLVVCSDNVIPDKEDVNRGWFCLKHEGEAASWKLVVSKMAPSEHIQILSISNTNYLFATNLEIIKAQGISIIENNRV